MQASGVTPSLAVLPEPQRSKPISGHWLTTGGWSAYIAGRDLDPGSHLIGSESLWSLDTRIGIALDPTARRAVDGALFSSQGVVFRKRDHDRDGGGNDAASGCDVGFLAEVSGATLPCKMTLRFGGDGRTAIATRVETRAPEIDYESLVAARRCRLILTTPGLFEGGWKPTGVTGHGRGLRFDLRGVRSRLVCAAVPRSEVVSGFDLARGRPKPAQRAAPAGSVYWLEDLEATPEAHRNLAVSGLWSDPVDNAARRAEGFNRCAFAEYRPKVSEY